MWLFTTHGFFSTVLATDEAGDPDSSRVVVRSRTERHLRALCEAFPELRSCEILETQAKDYRWRVVVDWMTWCGVAQGLAASVDYTNLKDRVREGADAAYVRSLHRVWSTMLSLQKR